MRILMSIVLLGFSITTFAMHNDKDEYGINQRRMGEYYDYDTQGTRGDRIKHNIGHGTLKVMTAPFRGIRKGYRGIKHVVNGAKNHAEIFLTDAASIDGRRDDLRDVLEKWEHSDDLKTIMERERKKGNRFLFGLPHDAWKLLKATIYTAGFRLPRATWRGLKHAVIGTRDCIGL